MSTTGMSSTSSADFRTLLLSEMEAKISRFDERVSAAMCKHPSSKERVRKAIRGQGAVRCPTRLKRISLDVILRYGDDLADLYCQFPDDALCGR